MFSLFFSQSLTAMARSKVAWKMELVSQQWQLELAWAQRLRQRVVAAQALEKTETSE